MKNRNALLPALLMVAATRVAAGADFDYSITGDTADAQPRQTESALMLLGGGGFVDDAFRWFLKKAGGGDIVVLKASPGNSFETYLHDTIGGCHSVETIAFHNREASHDPKIQRILQQADGIILGGGSQSRYADYWKGTPVCAALDAHVRSGRPLAGSSAGLAVLGQVCYTAHTTVPTTAMLTSESAMKDPFHQQVTLESDFLHLDLLRGVITDSHLTTRGRLGRLITFVARATEGAKLERPLGIGVDEKTALCIESNGSGRVFAATPEGRAWLVMPQQAPEVMTAGTALTYRDVKVISAGPDSAVHLPKRTVEKPAAVSIVSIVAGQLSSK